MLVYPSVRPHSRLLLPPRHSRAGEKRPDGQRLDDLWRDRESRLQPDQEVLEDAIALSRSSDSQDSRRADEMEELADLVFEDENPDGELHVLARNYPLGRNDNTSLQFLGSRMLEKGVLRNMASPFLMSLLFVGTLADRRETAVEGTCLPAGTMLQILQTMKARKDPSPPGTC